MTTTTAAATTATTQRRVRAITSASRAWAQRSLAPAPAPGRWSRAALGGCLAELSGDSGAPSLTLACSLVCEVQQQGEPVAWVTRPGSIFYPPDAADGGIDLPVLPVVRLGSLHDRLRAADQIARSGAFGLLVLDLSEDGPTLPLTAQSRLSEQAIAHGALVLCLTTKRARQPSLGSLVAVRGQARRIRRGDGRYVCRVEVLKDKRRGPGWTDEEDRRGPDGVR